jgi:hypothetical protein
MAPKYSPQQALDLIRTILNEGGYIFPSKRHAAKDRMPLRNVDQQDLEILLLETGRILREPVWDEFHGNYKYRVEGTDFDGDDLAAIVVIDEQNGRVLVVTVF